MPTVVFAGLGDPIAEPADYRGAARMFAGDYIVEEVDGGHFVHREHPDAFADRLLAPCDPAEPRFGRPPRVADIVQGLCPKWIVAP